MDGKCPEKANRGGREREKEREMEGEIQRERPRVRGRWGDSRGERGASKSSYKGLPRAGQHQDRMDGPGTFPGGSKLQVLPGADGYTIR